MVVVGLMTRCANQVAACMHGHLDMLMETMVPWKVWSFGIGACAWRISCIYMPSRHTHVVVAFPLPYCIEVMGGALGL